MTHLPIKSVVFTVSDCSIVGNDLVSKQKFTDSIDNCDQLYDDNVTVDHVNKSLIFKRYSKETVD